MRVVGRSWGLLLSRCECWKESRVGKYFARVAESTLDLYVVVRCLLLRRW